MAIPTDDINWSSSPPPDSVVDPGGSQKAAGWAVGQAPTAQNFNWLQRAWYRWISWLSDNVTVGLDPENGYKYDPPLDFKWNFTPIDGGFKELGTGGLTAVGGATINILGTPVFLQPAAAGAIPATVLVIPFSPRVIDNVSTLAVPQDYQMTNIRARIKGTGFSTITVKLQHADIAGAAGVVTDRTFNPTIAAGFANQDDAVTIALDFTANTYWWGVTIGATSGTASDTGLSALIATMTKTYVE